MQTKITKLNDKKSTAIYTQEINNVNFTTGEITEKSELKIVKEKNRHGFIQLYVDNINFLSSQVISNIERQVLIFVLGQMNYSNILKINTPLRKLLKVGTNLSDSSVSRALSGLEDKSILLKIDENNAEKYNINPYMGDEYLVNPQIVGKGSFNEMKSLRQTVITDFDFDTLEMKQEVIRESKYDGFDEVANSIDSHEVKEIRHSKSQDGKFKNTEVVIAEKEPENTEIYDVVDETYTKPIKSEIQPSQESAMATNNKELELEILKQKNEAKKLDIKARQVENENLKIRLELQREARRQEKTLFDDNLDFLPREDDPKF